MRTKLLLHFFFIFILRISLAQNTFLIDQNQTLQLIDNNGKILRGPYQSLYWYNDLYSVIGPNGYMLVDNDLNEIAVAGKDSICSIIRSPFMMMVLKVNGKNGVYDFSKKQIIAPKYDWIQCNASETDSTRYFFLVENDNKRGLLDSKGNVIYPCEYDEIQFNYGPDVFKFKKGELYGIGDVENKQKIEAKYEELGSFYHNRAIFKRNGLYGAIDHKFNEVIAPTFSFSPKSFYDGSFSVLEIEKPDASYEYLRGVIDSLGKIIVPVTYNDIDITSLGIIVNAGDNYDNKKYGFYDLTGKMVIPAKYSYIKNLNDEKILIVTKKDTSAICSPDGKFLTRMKYAEIQEFENERAICKNKKNLVGVVNTKGEEEIPVIYEEVRHFYGDCYGVYSKNKFGLVYLNSKNKTGQLYEGIHFKHETDTVFIVDKNKKFGLLDKNGKVLRDFLYDKLYYRYYYDMSMNHFTPKTAQLLFSQRNILKKGDLLYVEKGGQLGFVDPYGHDSIPYTFFDEFESYGERAVVTDKGKNYAINFKGEIIFNNPDPHKDTLMFYGHSLVLRGKSGVAILDANGKPGVFYDSLYYMEPGTYLMGIKNKNCSLLDTNGNEVIRNCPDGVNEFVNGFAIKRAYGNICAIYNNEGKQIWKGQNKKFAGTNMGPIGNSFCLMEDLEEVRFEGNDYDDAFSLPDCFYNLKKLKSLEIMNCTFDSVPPAIANLSQLRYLSLIVNSISSVADGICKLALLDTLIINTQVRLPACLSELKNLKHLDVRSNNLPPMPDLISLHLQSDSFPAQIEASKNLKVLHLSIGADYEYSETSADDALLAAKKAWSVLKNFDNLEDLVITGKCERYLEVLLAEPALIQNMKNLKHLSISRRTEEEYAKALELFPNIKMNN